MWIFFQNSTNHSSVLHSVFRYLADKSKAPALYTVLFFVADDKSSPSTQGMWMSAHRYEPPDHTGINDFF